MLTMKILQVARVRERAYASSLAARLLAAVPTTMLRFPEVSGEIKDQVERMEFRLRCFDRRVIEEFFILIALDFIDGCLSNHFSEGCGDALNES